MPLILENQNLLVPAPSLLNGLSEANTFKSLKLTTFATDLVSFNDNKKSIFLSARSSDNFLLVDKEAMQTYLDKTQQCLVWAVLSEKNAYIHSHHSHANGIHAQSAIYTLDADGAFRGGVTKTRLE